MPLKNIRDQHTAKSKRRYLAFLVAGLAVVLAIVWYGNTVRNESTIAGDVDSTRSAAAPASMPTGYADIGLARSQVNESRLTTISAVATKYRERLSLATLIQSALSSGDRQELAYAKLYLDRCSQLSYWSRGQISAIANSPSTSQQTAKAIQGFDRMCDRPSIDPERKRLRSAIDSAAARLDPRESVGLEGDLLLEDYLSARALRNATSFDKIGNCSGNTTRASLCDLAVLSAVCSNNGCDTEFQMARLCGLFEQCGYATLDEQLDAIAAIAAVMDSKAFDGLGDPSAWLTAVRNNARRSLQSR